MYIQSPDAERVTCPDCGTVYVDDPHDWSGHPHPPEECLRARLAAAERDRDTNMQLLKSALRLKDEIAAQRYKSLDEARAESDRLRAQNRELAGIGIELALAQGSAERALVDGSNNQGARAYEAYSILNQAVKRAAARGTLAPITRSNMNPPRPSRGEARRVRTMLTDEERKKVADEAVHRAERQAIMDRRDWALVYQATLKTVMSRKVFVESPRFGRRDIYDFIVDLIAERDEWKRRAEKHGCNVASGDPDCE